MTKSRFLEDPFASVAEVRTAFDLSVTETVLPELTGRYSRNGPNPMSADDCEYHWFLGKGIVPQVPGNWSSDE
jgi:carotenoid cleavage oxygenase